MTTPLRFVSFAVTVALVALTSGCGDDATVECLSNDVGKVCARADGAITFIAEGLEPGSDVESANAMVGPITFTADDDGRPLTGQIVIASG